MILTVNNFRKNLLDEDPPQNQLTSIKNYPSPEQVVLEIGQLRDSNEKKDLKNKSLLKIEEQKKEMEEYLAEMNLKRASLRKILSIQEQSLQ